MKIGLRKPSRHQLRRQAAVIDVGVRQQQGVEVAEPQRARLPVSRQKGPFLVHSAIDQQMAAIGLKIILRTGNLTGGPQELQLHGAGLAGGERFVYRKFTSSRRRAKGGVGGCGSGRFCERVEWSRRPFSLAQA